MTRFVRSHPADRSRRWQVRPARGAARTARANPRGSTAPYSTAVDTYGDIYVADPRNNEIRKIVVTGGVAAVTTVAGNPRNGSADGLGSAASFFGPDGVAVDWEGNLYVADTNNDTIRKIDTSGYVTTIAGSPGQSGSADGEGSAARFNSPQGIGVDHEGNVYVADTFNFTIRKITPAGVVSTFAGQPGNSGSADGAGGAARFFLPQSLAVDGAGDVFVTENGNDEIRMITPSGVVTTIAGMPGQYGRADGFGAAARFTHPFGIGVDGSGNVYVADTYNSTIRVGVPTVVVPAGIATQPQDSTVNQGQNTSFAVTANGTLPSYQWQIEMLGSSAWTNLYDGGEFSGSATATLSITGTPAALNGAQYQCVVNNPAGSATSAPATLTVDYPPSIVLQSQSLTAIVGQSVSFSVGIAGNPAPTYQWQVSTDSGATWTDLTDGNGFVGTGTATLGIIAAGAGQNGNEFRVVATNGSSSVMSSPVTLTVATVPGGDLVAYAFTTLAGKAPGIANGTGAAAQFNLPQGVAVDSSGNAYVADGDNQTIRKISAAGAVTTLAGAPGQQGTNDGAGGAARFSYPRGLAVDGAGIVYVVDGPGTIRRITAAGIVTTLAGSPYNNGYADGTGEAAQFNQPQGLAIDDTGNLYVADSNNNAIRKINPAGVVTTLAGNPSQGGDADGTGSAALFNDPQGVAVDSAGNVYVADTNNQAIRQVTPGGVVTTLSGAPNQGGSQDGPVATARFSGPQGVAVDGAGNIYVADTYSDTIREITAGIVTTLAGSFYQWGGADGTGGLARFAYPRGLAVNPSGGLYVADTDNNALRAVTPAGAVTTLAGAAGEIGSTDGAGAVARFFYPGSVAVDLAGNVYVADGNNATIRKITPEGAVTTLAGAALQSGNVDGTGSAARLGNPRGVAVDNEGNVYVGDQGTHTIRKITPAGVVTTLAGVAYQQGSTDGTGSGALFSGPQGVAVDAAGNVYVADSYNSTIRKITPAGVVTTLAGTAGQDGSADGTGAAARFTYPTGVAVDSAGNVYVADNLDYTIRKITPAGVVTTLAGSPYQSGSVDGTGNAARFGGVEDLAVDGAGNVFLVDGGNSTIRELMPAGVVTTLAGLSGQNGSTDGAGSAARFAHPEGIAVDTAGNLYVADTPNNTIRKGVPSTVDPVSITTQPQNSTINAGQSTSFTVAADGSTPLTFQWEMKTVGSSTWTILSDEGEFSGTATATLSITGATADLNQAQFQCVVTNGGTATTNPVTLTVNFAPAVVLQTPSDTTAIAGQSVSFSVGVIGSPAPTYQWQDSTNGGSTWTNMVDSGGFFGTASATLGISAATTAMSGEEFQLVATNASGSATSSPVSLTVTPLGGGEAAYAFTTLAAAAPGSADGTGAAAQFDNPQGVAVDSSGNTYVADMWNATIRMITPGGVVTTFAGSPGQLGGSDGTGSSARFNRPNGLAMDGSGNLYVADTGNNTIRKISPAGAVTTLAGTAGQGGNSDGTGANARFNQPRGVSVDGTGNVYVADSNNNTVRKVTPGGVVTTLAGNPNQNGSADGTGSAARFNGPVGVAVDGAGNVYVADAYNSTIRKITLAGVVTTLAGTANQGGSSDGTGSAAQFNLPRGITSDSAGDLYVADSNSFTIRAITPAGVVTTLAGSAFQEGSADGTGSAARFSSPVGIALDASGNLRVADSNNDTIREVTAAGVVTTVAGTPGQIGSADGTGGAARFFFPEGAAVDFAGNVYVADTQNCTIRKITPAGVVTTLAGETGPGQYGSSDGTGSAARFNDPRGVAVDNVGNVYVADTNNNTIRKVTPAGVVTTLAGNPRQNGSADGTGSAAEFNNPTGVAVDTAGNVYVADLNNRTIRKVTPAGVVTTLAGAANLYGNTDGTGSAARFFNPQGVAVDSAGNVYVVDAYAETIRKITPAGAVTTLAGNPNQGGSADGTGSAANFWQPMGVAVDDAGNVYVGDSYNNSIRKVTPAGVVTTLGGGGTFQMGGEDGLGGTARFNDPEGLAVDGAGNLYVADSLNSTIRKGTPVLVNPVSITAQPQNSTIDVGQNASFAVTAGGTGPFAYQWQISAQGSSGWTNLADGGVYSGSATATLSITGAGIDLAGAQFRCVVSSGVGTVTSNAATLTVSFESGILLQSGDETVIAGQSVSFSVGVVGDPAPTYQWQESTNGGTTWVDISDGGGFAGTSTPTLVIAAILGMDGDQFRAVATNTSGTVTSAPMALAVGALPGGDVVAYDFTTFAGLPQGSADGTGGAARFYGPSSVATDSLGDVYVADGGNSTIRKITSAGVVTTFAGSAGVAGSTDGQGGAARFAGPSGVAVDSAGNVYVADSGNNTVRKITPGGAVTTLAGTPGVSGSADGTGPAAQFNDPIGLAVDDSGNVYVADSGNSTIREIAPGGAVTTLAGAAGVFGASDGTGAAAEFSGPTGVAVDASGILYVADEGNATIRMIAPGGVVSTYAGMAGDYGYADGNIASAVFSSPQGVAVDAGGNVYVADNGNEDIREISAVGVVTTLAGTTGIAGSLDGTGSGARFNNPSGVAVDGSGDVFVADAGSNVIREITSGNVVSTFAGTSGVGQADGTGPAAQFDNPHGMATDAAGNVYVADSYNNTIRKITPGGAVTTLAGTPGLSGSADGTGAAAQFYYPFGVAVDLEGNVYVADLGNLTIRKITPGGVVTTLAGTPGVSGTADGSGAAAQFRRPHDVAVDANGNVYVADANAQTIRKITPSGVVTTFAGLAGNSGSADGTGSAARFSIPEGVAVDSNGNVYVADYDNGTIRKITPGGVVTTLAGTAGVAGSANGTGAACAIQRCRLSDGGRRRQCLRDRAPLPTTSARSPRAAS
jgi:streptogramin lyase